jgi:hypothetical protein
LLYVEDADVGVFAHHAPDMAPLAFALQLLRVFLLVLLDLRDQGGSSEWGIWTIISTMYSMGSR